MTDTVSLFLSRTGGPPFLGSVGYVNDAIRPLLEARGMQVDGFQPPLAGGGTEEAMLPFALAAEYARHAGRPRADIALYDGAGTLVLPPDRTHAARNVVLYHGLVYGTGNWLTNAAVDLHLGNSPYQADVLRALFATPDWTRRRLLNPVGVAATRDVRLPVPCVEAPDGHPGFAQGNDLPAGVLALADKAVLGHALQHDKQDLVATVAILYWLNVRARETGTARVMLLISDASLSQERCAALDEMLAGTGFRCADFFVPLPHLTQRAVVQVMRACRFALAYNRFPEPFGFYPLESVYQGCPVYTNGVGNNRHLLPPEQGIQVLETAGMAPVPGQGPDLRAYRAVAERIAQDLAAPDETRRACARGRDRIAATWSMANFGTDLAQALASLDEAAPPVPAFDELEVATSPLVRSLDLGTGVCFNDYATTVLEAAECALLRDLLGRAAHALPGEEMARIERQHRFFARGLLTLRMPPSSSLS
ncbi:hypothetical protein LJR143_003991 [Pseudoxanthomonas sp. LjRoot143]|uniref:hypothetical protein n=1 Tax=Pseudoxanthomonas sp. LjRoot143 TaxID=3342266 RepID=UPI003ECFB32B